MYVKIVLEKRFAPNLNSAPVIAIDFHDAGKLDVLRFFEALLWTVVFCLEAIPDRKLDRFIADPKNRGRILCTGLWRYSRHPNDFGEVLLLRGLYVMALSVPWSWLSAAGPLTIRALILFVSGAPKTEERMENDPEFARYKERTNIFFPRFPKAR